jgi:hypothetical protein
MQPVQLSLIPDPPPAPLVPTVPQVKGLVAGTLPAEAVAAATVLLAGVIAKLAAPTGIEVAADE